MMMMMTNIIIMRKMKVMIIKIDVKTLKNYSFDNQCLKILCIPSQILANVYSFTQEEEGEKRRAVVARPIIMMITADLPDTVSSPLPQ